MKFVYPIVVILFFFLSLFVYTKFAGPIPFSINSVTTTKSDSFQVTGEGKASVKPDAATVRLGVSANGATAKIVQDQMNLNINKVTEGIKGLGIDPKDIKTENYSVNPNYDYNSGAQKITGYLGNVTLVVKLTDTDKANSVIDIATQNGANQIGGVSFDVSDKSKAETEARQKAVDDAKAKALAASKVAGFKLGRLINYSESSNGSIPPIRTLDMAAGSAKEVGTQLQPGTNEIQISVTLSYEVN